MTNLQPKPEVATTNEIRLVGRVRDPVQSRVLAGGDEVLSFSIVVARDADASNAGARGAERNASRGQASDIIDISCRSARSRQAAAKLTPDMVIEVNGALHHRFWQAGGRTASRYEVDAQRIARRRSN